LSFTKVFQSGRVPVRSVPLQDGRLIHEAQEIVEVFFIHTAIPAMYHAGDPRERARRTGAVDAHARAGPVAPVGMAVAPVGMVKIF
jgi:hypothetical protein